MSETAELPRCEVIGHGVEAGVAIHCCATCAGQVGVVGLRDRVG